MARKKKSHPPGTVPAGNQSHFGPGSGPAAAPESAPATPGTGTGDQEQDPKRRLGDFEGKGEHSFVQPGGKKDANRHA